MADLVARDANEGDTRLLVTDFLCEGLGYDKYEDLTTEYQVKGEFADYGVRLDKHWAGEDLVVCWPDGALVNPNIVTRSFVRAARLAGLPRIRFHDLRHTWATLALEAGIPDKVVADRLGHSSVVVTLDTYTHVPDQTARTAAERVAGMLGI